MTAQQTYSAADIRREMTDAGSHWWDRDTMRMFRTEVVGRVYNGDNGIYFVTIDRQFDNSSAYTVRRYDPAEKQIHTAGELGEYDDKDDAIAAAKALAGKRGRGRSKSGKLTTVSAAEQLALDIRRNGGSSTVDIVEKLIHYAKRHHKLMEQACNGAKIYDEDGQSLWFLQQVQDEITAAVADMGIGVVFSGDPRGATVKLILPNGATNDWGNTGWCVPVSDDD